MVVSLRAYCHQPLQARHSRGPAPSYCSRTCRQAAYRARQRQQVRLEPLGLAAQTISTAAPPASTDSRVPQALVEGRSIGGAFIMLGREARVEFAWRCTKTGEALFVSAGCAHQSGYLKGFFFADGKPYHEEAPGGASTANLAWTNT